jgi:hypothetical protein
VGKVTEGVRDGGLRGGTNEEILAEFGSLRALGHLF